MTHVKVGSQLIVPNTEHVSHSLSPPLSDNESLPYGSVIQLCDLRHILR